MNQSVSTPNIETSAMSDEIYDHMAKWRRVLRDLAIEAGLKRFVNPSDPNDDQSNRSAESER